METTLIPEWAWKKKHFASGVRLAKFPKYVPGYVSSVPSTGYNPTTGLWTPRTPVVSNTPTVDKMPDLWPGEKKEKVEQGELRFWMGTLLKDKGHIAVCRACGYIGINHDKRNNHLKGGCGAVLMETIRQLKKKNICVVCGDKTNQTKWGMHICDQECQWEFAFENQRPDIFDQHWRKIASDECKRARKMGK